MATAPSPLRFAYSTINWGTTPDLAAVSSEIRESGWRAVELFWHDLALAIPQDRMGAPLRLTLKEGGAWHEVAQEELLDLVPDFRLDSVTAALFGGERLASYGTPWAETDANLLAIELADFAHAIMTGDAPETDGAQGLRSLAIAYGFLEAVRLRRTVTVDELIQGTGIPYQDAIVGEISA